MNPEIAKQLEYIRSLTPQALVRRDVLGVSMDFSKSADAFNSIYGLISQIDEGLLTSLPNLVSGNLLGVLLGISQAFKSVMDFNPIKMGSPVNARDAINESVQNALRNLVGFFPSIKIFDNKINSYINEAQSILASLNEIKSAVEKEKEEAKNIVSNIRESAGELGVSKYSEIFRAEADSHRTASKYWFWGTIFSAVLTTGAGIFMYFNYFANYSKFFDSGQLLQLAISKIVILTVLYFLIVWCSRNYKSHLHNYIVNRHRQNALNTFEIFNAATSDNATKNAVLIQTTSAIFSPQHSGYVARESDSSLSPKMFDALRDILGNTKV